jgi:hypothetical protein
MGTPRGLKNVVAGAAPTTRHLEGLGNFFLLIGHLQNAPPVIGGSGKRFESGAYQPVSKPVLFIGNRSESGAFVISICSYSDRSK